MNDHSEVEIKWEGELPPSEIIAKVREEIKTDLGDLKRPSDLCFHVVILTDDRDGPTVTLWGRSEEIFGGEYTQQTEWKPLSALEEDDTPPTVN